MNTIDFEKINALINSDIFMYKNKKHLHDIFGVGRAYQRKAWDLSAIRDFNELKYKIVSCVRDDVDLNENEKKILAYTWLCRALEFGNISQADFNRLSEDNSMQKKETYTGSLNINQYEHAKHYYLKNTPEKKQRLLNGLYGNPGMRELIFKIAKESKEDNNE